MKNFKTERVTHMSKPSYIAMSSSDWLKSHCRGDVDNYKEGFKYECCKDLSYCGKRLWAWSLLLEGMDG